MIKHYILTITRSLIRNKFFALINVSGLTIGMSLFLLIQLWISYERSFDSFHIYHDRIFQVFVDMTTPGKPVTIWSTTSAAMGPVMEEKIPEIEAVIRASWEYEVMIQQDNSNIIKRAIYVDSSFFRFFSFPLTRGNPQNVLNSREGIVISQSTAKTLFGEEDPVNRVIHIKDAFTDKPRDVIVSGVFEDIVKNSSLSFDIAMPMETYLTYAPWNRQWGNYNQRSFAVLREHSDVTGVKNKIRNFIKENRPDTEVENNELFLHPLDKLHLYDDFSKGRKAEGTIVYVRLFNIISYFVLLIACINYINLSTANTSRRNREMGLKKTIGASRIMLSGQFMAESFILNLLALILSLIAVSLILPGFNRVFDKNAVITLSGGMALLTGVMLFGSAFLSGMYPSLVLSAVNPINILRGGPNSSGKFTFRNGLVIFQFILSISMIIGILVIFRQVQYIRNKNLGFDRENVIRFIAGGARKHQDAFRQELMSIQGIKSISFSDQNPLFVTTATSDPVWDHKPENDVTYFQVIQADRDFINTMGIKLLEGENFPEQMNPSFHQYLINEKAAEAMGMKEPVGQNLKFWSDKEGKIIGLVRDFHHQSLHAEIRPLIIFYNPEAAWNVFVKISGENTKNIIAAIKPGYLKFEQDLPFDFNFLDADFEAMYNREILMQKLTMGLTFMAILISCLGLFGLSLFTIQRRTKEIAIRKVNGARIGQLILLLSRDFIGWVILSFIIASPLAWYFLNGWLENFAFRAPISLWIFAVAGGAAIFIALATISYHSIRAALANPVNSLRYE